MSIITNRVYFLFILFYFIFWAQIVYIAFKSQYPGLYL